MEYTFSIWYIVAGHKHYHGPQSNLHESSGNKELAQENTDSAKNLA
jgi:hypothetical protein